MPNQIMADQIRVLRAMALRLPHEIHPASIGSKHAMLLEAYEHLMVKWDELLEKGWSQDKTREWIWMHATVYVHPKTLAPIVVWADS